METLNYRYENGTRTLAKNPQIVGVVGSGNLEVLIESAPLDGACTIEIKTAAVGFGAIWEAVMRDFHAALAAGRHAHLDQRHGRHAGRGQPAARPGGADHAGRGAMSSYLELTRARASAAAVRSGQLRGIPAAVASASSARTWRS